MSSLVVSYITSNTPYQRRLFGLFSGLSQKLHDLINLRPEIRHLGLRHHHVVSIGKRASFHHVSGGGSLAARCLRSMCLRVIAPVTRRCVHIGGLVRPRLRASEPPGKVTNGAYGPVG